MSVSIFHACKGAWHGRCILNQQEVHGISSFLDSHESVFSTNRLKENLGIVFRGPTVGGEGFVLTTAEANRMIDEAPSCSEVIRPFLTGKDINQDPRQMSDRFVIDFGDRSEEEARRFGPCWKHLYDTVRLQRLGNKIKQREKYWWRFIGRQENLYDAISGFERVLACAEVSKYWGVIWVGADQVYAGKVVIFALKTDADFGFLNSCFHVEWAEKTASRLEDRPSYSLADTFETLPFPSLMISSRIGTELYGSGQSLVNRLNAIGSALHSHRAQMMEERGEGLTDVYNRFHDALKDSADVKALRLLHSNIDQAAAAAYGWTDLDLERDFCEGESGVRYTISEATRRDILDRLLALNHERPFTRAESGICTTCQNENSNPQAGTARPILRNPPCPQRPSVRNSKLSSAATCWAPQAASWR